MQMDLNQHEIIHQDTNKVVTRQRPSVLFGRQVCLAVVEFAEVNYECSLIHIFYGKYSGQLQSFHSVMSYLCINVYTT